MARLPVRLVIETATAACSVALLGGDGTVLAMRHEVVGRGHAERLVPMIAEVVAQAGRPAAILVDCGPGSFTGVRVGLAAARGLGLGWNVPVAGFSGLALIAAAVFAVDDAAALAVAIPGGHGELFVQAFARGPDPLGGSVSLTPPDAAAAFSQPLVAGGGAAALVAARGPGRVVDALPCAADAILLPPALTALAPVPLYGRAPDAKPRS